jgi:hypothetical protein
MKYFPIIILILFLTSCFDPKIEFEKEFYEKTSRITFPKNYKVLETFDNGEFLTATVLQMDSSTLQNFVKENGFDTLSSYLDIQLMSESYSKENKPVFTSVHNVYFIRKTRQKIHWTYIADLNSKRLWAEISYPDWGGQ